MTSRPGGSPSVFERWGRRGTGLVLGLAALVMLLIGATIGLAIGGSSSTAATSNKPAADSVDVGFLRDMTVHHAQGVLMAHIVQGEGGSSDVAGIAYDIEYQQTAQIGQMGGFLQLWDYPLTSVAAPMAWMTDTSMAGMTGMNMTTVDKAAAAAGAVMPGMATNAEMAQLKTLRGSAADIFFLQLMIRHHQGGLPMLQYAAKLATNPVVRNMAQKMADAQAAEIVSMTTLLTDTFKATPLAEPGAAGSSSTLPTTGETSGAAMTSDTSTAGASTSGDNTSDMSGMPMTTTSP